MDVSARYFGACFPMLIRVSLTVLKGSVESRVLVTTESIWSYVVERARVMRAVDRMPGRPPLKVIGRSRDLSILDHAYPVLAPAGAHKLVSRGCRCQPSIGL